MLTLREEERNAAAKAKLKAKKREMEKLCSEVSALVKDVAEGKKSFDSRVESRLH